MGCFAFFNKTTRKSNKMATFDLAHFYGPKHFGLRMCPFNPNHRVKDSKFIKHVQRCEQQYPARDSLKSHFNVSKTVINADDNSEQLQIHDQSIGISHHISDKHIVLDSNLSLEDNCIEVVLKMKDNCEENVDNIYEDLSPFKDRDDKSKEVIEVVVHDSNPMVQSLTINRKVSERPEESDTRDVDNNCLNSEGLGHDNWNSGYKHFTFFPQNSKSFDELTDDQIMEMAESFADIAIISRMTKKQKNKFNEKLLELQKLKNERKLKAFNELIMFREEVDPELQSIPTEIRNPRLNAKQVFKLRKLNDKILAKENLISKPSSTPVTTRKEVSDEKCLNAVCGACNDSIDLVESNVRQLTVFCSECSGFKFGGYFECRPCKLYGYFAANQIAEHMSNHYSEKDHTLNGKQSSLPSCERAFIPTEFI